MKKAFLLILFLLSILLLLNAEPVVLDGKNATLEFNIDPNDSNLNSYAVGFSERSYTNKDSIILDVPNPFILEEESPNSGIFSNDDITHPLYVWYRVLSLIPWQVYLTYTDLGSNISGDTIAISFMDRESGNTLSPTTTNDGKKKIEIEDKKGAFSTLYGYKKLKVTTEQLTSTFMTDHKGEAFSTVVNLIIEVQ